MIMIFFLNVYEICRIQVTRNQMNVVRIIMNKVLFIIIFFIGLQGCSTPKYVGKTSENYKQLSCTFETETCRIRYGDDGHISYSVEETGPNTYSVNGAVDLDMDIVGAMRPKISFFVIFMDNELVQHERRVKTGTRKATFEFEVTTEKPILKTSIEKMTFHYRT